MHKKELSIQIKQFKEGLSREKISQPRFAKRFYKDTVNQDADEETLDKHTDRFKKLIKKENHKCPELICSYIRYFNDRYSIDGRYTQKDRDAAWNMYVELDTRIATRKLIGGKTKSALESLAQLFAKHRTFSQQGGANCRQYYFITNDFFESSLRPFTSKWHQYFESTDCLSDDDDKMFRLELSLIQKELIKLKDILLDISQ